MPGTARKVSAERLSVSCVYLDKGVRGFRRGGRSNGGRVRMDLEAAPNGVSGELLVEVFEGHDAVLDQRLRRVVGVLEMSLIHI